MRSKYSLPVIVIILLFSSLLITSCNKDDKVKSYKEEIKVEKIPQSIQNHAHGEDIPGKPESNIKWESPEGWVSIKTDSKIRLATYSVKSGSKEAVCTIIPLSGDGGGLKANILMWLSGLIQKEFSEVELNNFISEQKQFITSDNHKGIFIDFTTITGKESDLSMLVSVIELSGKTLFIKFSGATEIVTKNKEKLFKLSKSIKSEE